MFIIIDSDWDEEKYWVELFLEGQSSLIGQKSPYPSYRLVSGIITNSESSILISSLDNRWG